jgi:hypothetical protein
MRDVRTLEAELYQALDLQLNEIIQLIGHEPGHYQRIELPDPDDVDRPLEELAALVAKTSNAYGRIARFAGFAKAEYKLAKGRYDRKYKQARIGRNDAERDRAAMEACEQEHLAMTTTEAIADLAEALEHGARVASESARKIYDKVNTMSYAQRREDHGIHPDRSFTR